MARGNKGTPNPVSYPPGRTARCGTGLHYSPVNWYGDRPLAGAIQDAPRRERVLVSQASNLGVGSSNLSGRAISIVKLRLLAVIKTLKSNQGILVLGF